MLPVSGDAQFAPIRTVSVEALIAQFDTNPFGMSRALRQLRDIDAGRFQEAALRALAEMPETSGIRFLAALIPLSEPILELIANPKAFEYDSARRILEVMRRIDTQTEAKLLRLISANPAKPLPPQMTDRILDLVDAVSDGPRLVPVLMQIFRSANPYLRARLSLSIGRHHRNKDWLEDRMRDPDPRVRANAVEANWNQKDETSFTLFTAALRDAHHRVIGNGAVGLYYAGDIRCLRVFGDLLVHPEPNCRAAGLWAIGHIQDTRYQIMVAALVDERDVMVRRSFVVTQARLKCAAEILNEQPKLKLRLIKATRRPLAASEGAFHNHVFVEVKNSDGAVALQGLKTLQFQVFENDQIILDYSVQERTSYIKPGTYDIYFDNITKSKQVDGQATAVRHLKVVVLTETATGQHDSFDFGEPEAKPDESPFEPAVQGWDTFK